MVERGGVTRASPVFGKWENFLDRFDNGRPFFADSSRFPRMHIRLRVPP